MKKSANIQRIHIVNQEIHVIGGCCPDLPDSAYMNREDAQQRIQHLYNTTKEAWESSAIEIDTNPEYTYINENECEITSVCRKYWFHTYIVGSVPLITDYQKDWDVLSNMDGIPG